MKLSVVYKIPKVFQERGLRGLLSLVLKKLKNKLKGKLTYNQWLSKKCLTSGEITEINQQINRFQIYPKF